MSDNINDLLVFPVRAGAENADSAQRTTGVVCPQCGAQLPQQAVFCGKCGASVQSVSQPQQSVQSVSQAQVFPVQSQPQPYQQAQVPPPLQSAPQRQSMPKPSNQPIDLLKFSSGLGLTAANPRIHSKLIQILSVKPNLPLDIFEQAEVLREEHYFGPAYAFFCNGTAPYTYDAAMYVKRTWTEDSSSGNTAWQTTKTETDTQWQPVSSSVSLSKTIYVTGNSDYADQIDKLFNTTSIDGKLVGINELGLPADAVLLGDNLSEQQAYTRHAVPSVKEQLRFQADAAMKTASKGKETRNFHMSDASVQKDSAVDKVLLGSYCVILGYRGQEYPVWLSGDGSSGYADALPRDSVQERLIADKKREQENIPPAKTGLLTLGIVGGMLLAFFGYASPYHIGSLLGLALAAACFVFRFQKSKEYRNRYDAVQKEIDALTSRFDGIAKDFKNRRQALKGIYRNVSGDPSAF